MAAGQVTCGTFIAIFICDLNDTIWAQESLLSWPALSVLLPSSDTYKKRPRFKTDCVFPGFNNSFNKLFTPQIILRVSFELSSATFHGSCEEIVGSGTSRLLSDLSLVVLKGKPQSVRGGGEDVNGTSVRHMGRRRSRTSSLWGFLFLQSLAEGPLGGFEQAAVPALALNQVGAGGFSRERVTRPGPASALPRRARLKGPAAGRWAARPAWP